MSGIRTAAATAAAITLTGTTLALGQSAQASQHVTPDSTVYTAFGFSGSAWGTRATLPDKAAQSGRTAWSYLSCTNTAGVSHGHRLAGVTPQGPVSVSGVSTRTWTKKVGGRVAAHGESDVARVSLGSGLTSLAIKGVKVTSESYHSATGFHRSGKASIGSISAQANGVPIHINLHAAPGTRYRIGSLGTLTFLGHSGGVTKHSSHQTTNAVKITLPSGRGSIVVGSAFSGIRDGLAAGPLSGIARPLTGSLLQGTLRAGTPQSQPLACQGTGGHWRTTKTAGVKLAGLHVGAATARARGNHRDALDGYAQTQSRLAHVGLEGRLSIDGVVASAKTVKKQGVLSRSATGTRVGSIRANGRSYRVPGPGRSVTIRGLATITGRHVVRLAHGLSVTALTVRLLDVAKAHSLIHLGYASAKIGHGIG